MEDVRALAAPLRTPADLDPVLERVGDARIVLLGEASHGTHEYYAWRAALTRRLLEEKGFALVAVEGDWPECYEVNRCVRLRPGAQEFPRAVLDAFDRWPTWMWANEEVVQFAEWLRERNSRLPEQQRAGFYGLDVYSLWGSMRALLDYLREHEPQHVDAALRAVECFQAFGEDPQDYALASRLSPASCEPAVVELLARLCQERAVQVDGDDPEARSSAEQNAAVAAGAERYYRAMVGGQAESWNVRDVHMQDTLDRLLEQHGKAVVWEHNTHVGDARATDMAAAGMVNVGQLARERHGEDAVVVVGFGGHRGAVVAARQWGAPMEAMRVPPARAGSVEAMLHDALGCDAVLVFPSREEQPDWLRRRTDHRAIGVVYSPDRERWGNYVPSVLGQRYDAFLWFEQTRPLRPLHGERPSSGEDLTWPWTV